MRHENANHNASIKYSFIGNIIKRTDLYLHRPEQEDYAMSALRKYLEFEQDSGEGNDRTK